MTKAQMQNAPTVMVTGAAGYIATELVQQLLAKGYNIRATVRDPSDAAKVAHLHALADALPGTLQLFAADLLVEGSFDEATRGASVVFHTASPYFMEGVTDPHSQLIQPAIKGTENVLSSVIKNKEAVRRVVLTSSCAAVMSNKHPVAPKNGKLYTEADWNERSTIEDEPYCISKVTAELVAWQLAAQEGLDLVVINPIFVVGPVISRRSDATSVQLVKRVLEGGTTKFNRSARCYVDVRDVARAHILAAENPAASGRYILSHAANFPAGSVTDALKKRYPSMELVEGAHTAPQTLFDNRKATEGLGMKLIPEQESFIDMATSMVQLGVATPTLA